MPNNGLMQVASPYSVAETLQRLQSILGPAGSANLRLVDHSGEAEKVG